MPPRPASRTLRSQAGAFDLPSILVGVVAVGILVAGVLAAIFGVIPFSQDKGAAQDLSAINTAQGVSKAQNGAFTDKAGLTAAGLTGGLPAGMTVTAENGGAGYCATAPSASGKTFAIAAEQTTPWRGDCTFTTNWTKQNPSATVTGWGKVAISPDGRHLISHQKGITPFLFTSSDAGTTWTRRDVGLAKNWRSVAISDDGKTMMAGQLGGNLFTSTDAGATWVDQPMNRGQHWYSLDVSADGKKMIAGSSVTLWTSSDAGATWTNPPLINGGWESVAVTPDGQTMIAGQTNSSSYGALYVSSDSGATWGPGLPERWVSVDVSSDGRTMVATTYTRNLHISKDKGVTWVNVLSGSGVFWQAAISGDGRTVIAGSYGSYIYTSPDHGMTWKTHTNVGARSWSMGSVAVSADGKTLVAREDNAFFTSIDGGASWVNQGVTLNNGAQWYGAAVVSADSKTVAAGSSTGDFWLGNSGRRVTG